jgi:hypothetical protein
VRKVKDLEAKYSVLKGSVQEKDHWIENVHQVLNDENAGLLDRLGQGQARQTLLEMLRRPPMTSRADVGSSLTSLQQPGGVAMDAVLEGETSRRGAGATTDEALLHHLLALYFTWVHPVYMLFSERHFMSSFRNNDSIYCSQSMVNAMCAVGCCYLIHNEGREVDAKYLGQRFYLEAWSDMRIEEDMTLVSAVTYAILFLFELSQGQVRNASSHLRLSVESLRSVNKHYWSEEAFQVSLWGVQTLNT